MLAAFRPKFEVKTAGPVTVVKIHERRMDDPNVQAMGEEVGGLTELPGQEELHLDFDEVGYMSSTGLAKLVALHLRSEEAGSHLVVKNLDALLCDLFRVTRLDTVLDVRPKE
jgi:anti-anti-sigma factor